MKKLFFTAACLAAVSVCGAVTVTVDGVGGGGTTFAKLSQAVAYVNANSSNPNVINITAAPAIDDTQILINVPVTINGDPANSGNPVDVRVDVGTIRSAADVGGTGRSYIEVAANGDVTINRLSIHPTVQGNTTQVDPISFFKPAAGVGNYVLNNVVISGSDATTLAIIDPLSADPYYPSNTIKWYAYLEGHGIYNFTNAGGAGVYSATLNNCQGSVARSHVVYIANQSGTTTINGGVYTGAGEDSIRVVGGTGVKIQGTPTNRVRLSTFNSSSGGMGIRVRSAGVIDKISYVDIINNTRAALTATPPSGTGILVDDGTITLAEFVRTNNIAGHGLIVYNATGVATVKDSTFHANAAGTNITADPVKVVNGTLTATDSIFTSKGTGQVIVTAGTVTLTNCALPTDGTSGESLNATPVNGTATVNNAINTSPQYVSVTATLTDAANTDLLRPTNAAYNTAHTGGTALTGGAGSASAVSDWAIY